MTEGTKTKIEQLSDAYEGIKAEPIGDNILAQISATADAIVKADEEIARIEAELKRKIEARRQLAEDELPMLMEAADLRTVTTRNGYKVTLDESVYANISKERASEAFRWLINNGHSSLIKNEFKVSFPKGESGAADQLEEYLATELGGRANVGRTVSVHPSTLTSWVRAELEMGHDLPQDLLGIRRKKVCKIS